MLLYLITKLAKPIDQAIRNKWQLMAMKKTFTKNDELGIDEMDINIDDKISNKLNQYPIGKRNWFEKYDFQIMGFFGGTIGIVIQLIHPNIMSFLNQDCHLSNKNKNDLNTILCRLAVGYIGALFVFRLYLLFQKNSN